jgi:hypothetical protein
MIVASILYLLEMLKVIGCLDHPGRSDIVWIGKFQAGKAEGAADVGIFGFDAIHGQVVNIANIDAIARSDRPPRGRVFAATMLFIEPILDGGCTGHLFDLRALQACYLA